MKERTILLQETVMAREARYFLATVAKTSWTSRMLLAPLQWTRIHGDLQCIFVAKKCI